jgi:hypothetical protein
LTWFLTILIITLSIVLAVSLVRWNLSRALRKSIDLSKYEVFDQLKVSAAAKLKAGETLGIPIKCSVAINQRELHLIPTHFHPTLFMTDFPFTFAKKANKKLKIRRSEGSEIVFVGRQRKSSVFGSELEVTIQVVNAEEKKRLLQFLKSWK